MSPSNQNQFSSRVLQQTISGSLKQELAAAHLQTTTRRSNKELKFLTSQIAQYPFANLEQAQTAGVLLGQHLAAMAQQRGQPILEGGIIQQLRFQPELFSVAGLGAETPQTEPDSSDSEDSTSVEGEQLTAETQSPEFPVHEATSSLSAEAGVEATPEFDSSEQLSPDSEAISPEASETLDPPESHEP